jgi:hypothetical protein
MFDMSTLLDIAERLGKLLSALKPKLVAQPDEAAAKLADVLEEISKIYDFVWADLIRYQILHCDADGSNLPDIRAVLLEMESGALEIEGNKARGHCHRIKNIYDVYLYQWLEPLFRGNPNDWDQIQDIFNLLGNMDDFMVRALRDVGDWLMKQSSETLDLVDEG